MGSVAMDRIGDMAMGYSVSGSTTNPSIAVTGRAVGDPPMLLCRWKPLLSTAEDRNSEIAYFLTEVAVVGAITAQ